MHPLDLVSKNFYLLSASFIEMLPLSAEPNWGPKRRAGRAEKAVAANETVTGDAEQSEGPMDVEAPPAAKKAKN